MDAVSQLKTALGGRYEIDREVGRGGMATVYLARDVRHNRRVALKVLNPELGAVLGVERFLSEIQVTANLQHPNLLPLFDSGEADGLLFYVMPYVEGESLRALLNREKQLPIDEAIHIATAVCSALEHAHRHGVIHRDLKPENILLHEGQPLIADFGIALAVSMAGGGRVTQTGISLGTPQYMSPEQATGDRPVDGRSDIYSLACVLYEMLTGEPPHIGNTVQSIIAKVLTDKPHSVRLARDTVPEHVDYAIQRALAKLPADRWASAQEFANALHGKAAIPPTRAARRPVSLRERITDPVVMGLTVLLLIVAGGALWPWKNRLSAPSGGMARFEIQLPPNVSIDNIYKPVTISPNGKYVVFRAASTGAAQLFRRGLDEISARALPGTENAGWPFVSLDSRWIGFLADGQLKKIPMDGGPAMGIATLPGGTIQGEAWTLGNVIVLGSFQGSPSLSTVPASSGTPKRLTKLDTAAGEVSQRWPVVLDDGQTILYVSWPKNGLAGARIGVTSLESGDTKILELPGTTPLGVVDGQLLYVRVDGALMAAPFDVRRRAVTGEPVALLEGINLNAGSGSARIALGGSTLVYLAGGRSTRPAIVDSTGIPRSLTMEPATYSFPAWSPDGQYIAFGGSSSGAVAGSDIWLLDMSSNALTRFTSDGGAMPSWSRDGKRIVFLTPPGSGHTVVWQRLADGSAPAEKLFDPVIDIGEAMLAPDGHTLVYRTAIGGPSTTQRDIWYVDLAGDRKPKPLLTSRFNETEPRVSPDGTWIAYQSDEGGNFQVYVRPFPGPGPVTQVSIDGGFEPVWAPDGRRLFYRHAREIVAATVLPGAPFRISSRRVLFEGSFFGVPFSRASYDVAPDGKRFVMLRTDESGQLTVVLNWLEDLRARTAK